MYVLGAMLLPSMAVAGVILLVAGATGGRDGLAVAGAILLAGVAIASRGGPESGKDRTA